MMERISFGLVDDSLKFRKLKYWTSGRLRMERLFAFFFFYFNERPWNCSKWLSFHTRDSFFSFFFLSTAQIFGYFSNVWKLSILLDLKEMLPIRRARRRNSAMSLHSRTKGTTLSHLETIVKNNKIYFVQGGIETNRCEQKICQFL